jgi:hypothetical protein
MANKTVTVRPSGGTYTTLAAAITGEVTANANLVTMAGILTIQIEGDWSGGADSSTVNITGFTTSALYYVNITTDEDNKAGTAWDTGKYRLYSSASGYKIEVNQAYTRISNIQAGGNVNYDKEIIANRHSTTIIDSIYVNKDGAQTTGAGLWNYASGITVINSIFSFSGTGSNSSAGSSSSTDYYYNCTFQKNYIKLGSGTTSYLKNCFAQTYTTYAGTIDLTTCASSDTTGSSGLQSIAYSTDNFTSVTAGSEDLSLVSGSDLIDVGTDLSADATYPFDWDITGATRTGTWDVGAYEYVSAGGIKIPVVMHHLAIIRRN